MADRSSSFAGQVYASFDIRRTGTGKARSPAHNRVRARVRLEANRCSEMNGAAGTRHATRKHRTSVRKRVTGTRRSWNGRAGLESSRATATANLPGPNDAAGITASQSPAAIDRFRSGRGSPAATRSRISACYARIIDTRDDFESVDISFRIGVVDSPRSRLISGARHPDTRRRAVGCLPGPTGPTGRNRRQACVEVSRSNMGM